MLDGLLSVPLGPYNPWHPDHRRDPYRSYRRLREGFPVFRSPGLRCWVVSRYRDVCAVLRDPRFALQGRHPGLMWLTRLLSRDDPDIVYLIDHSLLNLDGPDHDRIRGLVNQAFTPRRVAALQGRIEEILDELLGAAARRGEMELVRDLAHPLPMAVLAELFGVPPGDRERFMRWSDQISVVLDPFSTPDSLGRLKKTAAELSAYFRGMLAERRREPRDDLLSAMIAAEREGRVLGEVELLALCSLLLAAGHQTTTNLIGSAVVTLLSHPGERERLMEEPALMESAVEELVRFEAPVQFNERVLRQPVTLGGRTLRQGQTVWALLGSANRDPERFPEPDRLDVARGDNRHVSFGLGTHACLGAPLARLEVRLALGELLRRFPDLRTTAPTEWRPSAVLRGPGVLPLRLRSDGGPCAR